MRRLAALALLCLAVPASGASRLTRGPYLQPGASGAGSVAWFLDAAADCALELRGPGGQKVVSLTLLKRPGQLDDVASACVFLCSDEQNYMTGQVLSVAGGAVLP